MPFKKKYKKTSIDYNVHADYLLIVESPSKCKKIENFLGINFACIASIGHLQTIQGLKSIDIKNNYNPSFTIIDEKKQHIENMRNIISKFSQSNIYLATDDDREGEAIAWHICKLFDLDLITTKRVIFHEITKNAVVNGVQNPTKINLDIVFSQFSRQILDIIVGYKISPFLWKYLYNYKENSLSAGRCQTPALRLIYDSYRKNSKDYKLSYKITGEFLKSKGILFNLNKNIDDEKKMISFLESSKNFCYKLKIGETSKTYISSPMPFSTSRLLQVAGNILNYSPKQTMLICQKLYQAGYITYMRTESTKYSSAFLNTCKEKIINDFGEKYLGDIKKITNFDVANPHEAIRVTSLNNKNIKIDNDTKSNALYKLIYSNTIESCMEKYSATITKILINTPYKEYEYEYKNEIPIFMGWKAYKKDDKMNEDGIAMNSYFKLLNNSNVECNWVCGKVNYKNNNYNYTEHSLINKLESLGIGRPSTYASIVDVIQERKYVEKKDIIGEKMILNEYKLIENNIIKEETEKECGSEKNKLVITNLGIITIEFLCDNFSNIFSYDYTKDLENLLDKVAVGENKDWYKICEMCNENIRDKSKDIKKIEKCNFKLDEDYEVIFERYGPCLRKEDKEGNYEYFNIRNEIELDIERLKKKDYKFSQLIQENSINCGLYNNEEIVKKIGKYGPYIEYNGRNISLKDIKKDFHDINLEDIKEIIEKNSVNKNVLREFTSNLSIRKGKYGSYGHFEKVGMKKPVFYNIKKFKGNFMTCEKEEFINWLNDNYNTKDEDFV